MSATDSSPEDLGDGLDTLAKAAAVVAIAAYGIGLATVSLYLRQFDITLPDPEVLKARFILTGVCMMAVAALCFAGPVVGARFARVDALGWLAAGPDAGRDAAEDADAAAAEERPPRRYGFLAAGILAPPLAVTASLGFVQAFPWASSRLYGSAAAACALGAIAACAVWATVAAAGGHIRQDLSRPALTGALAALALLATYFYVAFSAAVMYPAVPQQLGGGRPKHEQLVFRRDAVAEAQQLGMRVTARRLVSQPVDVIFHADGSKAVRVPGVGVVEIDDSLVVGARSPRPAARPKPATSPRAASPARR